MTLTARPSSTAFVLEVDPELGMGIPEPEWDAARAAARAQLIGVAQGPWDLPAGLSQRTDLAGFLIVDGLVCREVSLRDRHMLELLGPGDVIIPPASDGAPQLGGPVKLTAVLDSKALVLGSTWIAAATRWPALLTRLLGRIEAQREHLAIQGLIAHLPRAEDRILLVLRHLSERWGKVTPRGTLIPLPLTHDLLAHLSAARRSTATLAISTLEADGLIRREEDGSWLLPASSQAKIDAIALTADSPRSPGRLFRSRRRTSELRAGV